MNIGVLVSVSTTVISTVTKGNLGGRKGFSLLYSLQACHSEKSEQELKAGAKAGTTEGCY